MFIKHTVWNSDLSATLTSEQPALKFDGILFKSENPDNLPGF